MKKQFSHLVTMRIANSKVKNKGRESIVPNQKQGVQQPAKYGGSYLPSCKTNFVIVLLAQTILFSHFINTTAYLLGRWEPSSPSTKGLHAKMQHTHECKGTKPIFVQARTPSHVVYTNSFSLSLLFIWLLSLSLSVTHTLYVSHIHTHTLTREHERKSTKSFSAHRRKSLFSSVWSWSTEEVPFPRIENLWNFNCLFFALNFIFFKNIKLNKQGVLTCVGV